MYNNSKNKNIILFFEEKMKDCLKIKKTKKFSLIKNMYEEKFPLDERIASEILENKIRSKKYNLYFIKNRKELIGYFLAYHNRKNSIC